MEMSDENDSDVLTAWAKVAAASPDAALDARVMADFRAYRLRRRLVPAAALAACLVLAFAAAQLSMPATRPAEPSMPRGGLLEGSAATFLMEAPLVDRSRLKRAPAPLN
jgi:hypothetical protein